VNLKFWKKKSQYSVVEFNIDSEERFALRDNKTGRLKDLNGHYWWPQESEFISDCLTTKEEACKLKQLYSEPRVVDCAECRHES